MVAEISECFFVFAKRLYSSRRVKTVIFIRVAYIDFFNTHLVFDLDTHLVQEKSPVYSSKKTFIRYTILQAFFWTFFRTLNQLELAKP